ncbi:MAG: Hsp20/alpha crystallin family protein, partial [Parcubacteria group bacterium]|nr:Hsp20/alpha crystallin family protein [Parcubacteria group bacterium]
MVRFLNKLTRIKEGEQDSVSEGEEAAGSTEPEAAAESAGGGNGKDWIDENYEGQLSVDVYGTASEVVVVSTIAGVKPEDIDISISNDMLTIRGQRSQEKE